MSPPPGHSSATPGRTALQPARPRDRECRALGVGSALEAQGAGDPRREPRWGRGLEQGAGCPRPALPAPAPAASRFQPAAQVPPGGSAPVRRAQPRACPSCLPEPGADRRADGRLGRGNQRAATWAGAAGERPRGPGPNAPDATGSRAHGRRADPGLSVPRRRCDAGLGPGLRPSGAGWGWGAAGGIGTRGDCAGPAGRPVPGLVARDRSRCGLACPV